MRSTVGEQIVVQNTAQTQLFEDAALVAPRDTTVLLTGESGTGKDVLARYIHRFSPRVKNPYVVCDCAAISPSLLESELFGFRRGAFTGAFRDSPGYMAASHTGTLFLDEVAELNLPCQSRLLRFLEDRTVVPVGEVTPRKLDVRIVAATNRDIENLVKEGNFREDLYFRLDVVNLHVKPLRERREEIIPLAEHFRRKFSIRHKKTVVGFTDQAKETMLTWSWPGNVRELRNAIERAVILSRGTWIDCADFPPRVLKRTRFAEVPSRWDGERTFSKETERFQRTLLEETLKESDGNRREAAERLKLSVHQIKYLIRKFGLQRSRW